MLTGMCGDNMTKKSKMGIFKNPLQKQLMSISPLQRKACDLLYEAISDEEKAPPMYEKLLSVLRDIHPDAEKMIPRIIRDEIRHKKILDGLSSKIYCDAVKRTEPDMILEKDQYKLPVHERTKRARKFLEQF